ncbi:glycoside hydrolase family 32 protein [Microbacterium sp. E-13]|uniref:glycoside hydrolase family 32 protein n=1 Tax=Microbacterium sp. E-13 TaxID=3404048 RepID=UPI003CEDEF41
MRPRLHFTAETGWINDPHGITFRDGVYHAFYQYVPGSTVWAPNCHWGHAVGPDLLSLKELPVAIAPGDGDGGIWTGSLVQDGEDTRILYTSTSQPDIGIGRIRIATPTDSSWIGWEKGDFVADAPPELDIIAYRDPFIRREADGWRMFVGAGLRDGTAMALSYVSDDLEGWAYSGVALQRSTRERDPVWTGALWECPQIFDLDGRAVMVSSVWDDDVLHYAGYAVGDYAGGEFVATSWGRLTYGDSLYAPSLFQDADGRPCLSFWMRGIADTEAGWASAHSVPYILRLDDELLIAEPHPDLAAHRVEPAREGDIPGVVADIEWSPDPGATLSIESGDREVALLRYRGDHLTIETEGTASEMPARGDVRVIVDGPVLEVSSAAGVFGAPISPAHGGIRVSGSGGRIESFPLA